MPSPKNRIIIDTDPGVDDIIALLLAFSAKPEDLEVLLVSVTFGNTDVQNCLRNTVSLFHWIEKEISWRKVNGLPEGFETLRAHKPLVAVGAEEPLANYSNDTNTFEGVHSESSHARLTPEETWKSLFVSSLSSSDADTVAAASEAQQPCSLFIPLMQHAHLDILRLLRENEPNTITIVAIGPLTTCALAAAADPETFLRAKELLVMGGANFGELANVLTHPNTSVWTENPPPFNLIKAPDTPLRAALNERNRVAPGADFNTYADSIAAARVYALTSALPESTMPLVSSGQAHAHLKPYPNDLTKRLRVVLFPLDITSKHELTRAQFTTAIAARLAAGSPLAAWTSGFLSSSFRKIEGQSAGLALHDPLCVWYAMAPDRAGWTWEDGEDIRVETGGRWTGAMRVVRDGGSAGNRVRRCVGTPGQERFAGELLESIFG